MKITGMIDMKPEVLRSPDRSLGWHIRLTGSVGGWAAYVVIPFGAGDGAKLSAEDVSKTIVEDIMREI